jgi:lariat debranching enzyme
MPSTFAVEGCCHGDLDRIYEVIDSVETTRSVKTDFVICCGDFQAIRTEEELETLACPPVYRHMKDFHHYWKGHRIPKCLTLFIGGNHEAAGHLRDMSFGGYASDKIFYLGSSGVFKVNGLRIAGLTGIYKSHDYDKPIFEAPPYNENTKRSAYHVRRFEIEKLMQLQQPVDIVVSHDWPTGITDFGDTEHMLRLKDKTGQLRSEIGSGQLGNPHTMALLRKLKPKFWFSGHMHIKYAAQYEHPDGSITRFLALDKCIPRRPFLQFISVNEECEPIPHPEISCKPAPEVCLDLEWLAILLKSNDAFPVPSNSARGPPSSVSPEEIEHVCELLRTSQADPRPVETPNGDFLMPYFGRVHPGDERYRKWICDILRMRDWIGDSSFTIPTIEPENTPVDSLFFEDI